MFRSEEKRRRNEKYGLAKLELAAVAKAGKLKRLDVLRQALIGPIPESSHLPCQKRRSDT
jgi:hypothetical protein